MKKLLISQKNELEGILYRLILFAGLLFLLGIMPESCSHKLFQSQQIPASKNVLKGAVNH